MRAREEFNNLMPIINEQWVAKVLGLKWNPSGIDVIGDKCVVEVKFSLPREPSWTVLEYQMAYAEQNSDKNAYWGLGIYHLKKEVDIIEKEENLEKLVLTRELWLVDWNWMNQFSPSDTKCNGLLRYPKIKLLPQATETYKIFKGKIHLTQSVNLGDFPALS